MHLIQYLHLRQLFALVISIWLCLNAQASPNPWHAVASLPKESSNHTATLMPDGRVFVVGGRGFNGILSSTVSYDVTQNIWTTLPSLASARQDHTATLLPSGKLLIAGGFGGGIQTFAGNVLSSAELYDAGTDAWISTGTLALARMSHTATLLPSGKVVIAGGITFVNSMYSQTASVESYDPVSNSWSTLASMPAARSEHTSTRLSNGKIFIVGGSAGGIYLNSAVIYDTTTNTWVSAANLNFSRANHGASLLANGKVLVVGGSGDSGSLFSAEIYDPGTNTWQIASPMLAKRTRFSMSQLSTGKVLVSGGYNSSQVYLADAELFDIGTNSWGSAGKMSDARSDLASTVLTNDKVLAIGGWLSGSYRSTVDIYDTVLLAPDPPTIGSAVAGNANATITFIPPANSGTSPIISYTILAYPNYPVVTGSCIAPCSSITVSGLSNGSAITFAVAATNSVGTGLPSAYSNYVIPKATQSIFFQAIFDTQVTASALMLNATSSAGLPITFSTDTPGVCVVSQTTVTLVTVGVCTINAVQLGNYATSPAVSVTQSFRVLPPNINSIPSSRRGLIDIDGDGKSEIILRNTSAQLIMAKFVNNAFQFTPIADPGSAYRLIGIGDFDGDGKSDLAFQNITQGVLGDIKIWRNFSPANEIYWRQVKRVWEVQAVGDLDADGYGDLVWRYTVTDSPDTGVSYIWFTNGNGVTQVRKRGGAPLDWTLLGAADINGDGAADMIYVSPSNQVRALMATSNRTCANLFAGNLPAGYQALRLADFSGRKNGDILLYDAISGNVQLLSLDAAGVVLPSYTGGPNDANASCMVTSLTVQNQFFNLPNVGSNQKLWATGDFNGDGVTDIVWQRPDGTLILWLMTSNVTVPIVVNNIGTSPDGYAVFQP